MVEMVINGGGDGDFNWFPCCVFHVCNFWYLPRNTTGKYKYKIMKIWVSWGKPSKSSDFQNDANVTFAFRRIVPSSFLGADHNFTTSSLHWNSSFLEPGFQDNSKVKFNWISRIFSRMLWPCFFKTQAMENVLFWNLIDKFITVHQAVYIKANFKTHFKIEVRSLCKGVSKILTAYRIF